MSVAKNTKTVRKRRKRSTADQPSAEASERRRAPVRAGAMVPGLTSRAMRARGFMNAEIVSRWDDVVGEDLARITRPAALKFPPGKRTDATLVVRAASATALELQHRAPQLIERVNVFFGYGAVTRLSIEQGPLPARPPHSPRPAAPDPAIRERVARKLDSLSGKTGAAPDRDSGLRQALLRLGTKVYGDEA